MAMDLKKSFDKKTLIGIVIGVATLAGSYLAQNFVPESLDTKKKLRPIVVPILVAILAAIGIKKRNTNHLRLPEPQLCSYSES
ncbi:hypothetical protein LEP1GSC123_0917 [Leptospira borgpetersenii str. 200701203]|uniref:Uncharacterized protein n=1 Tax=Leptospira borgpetersenii str. 200701203 TaxID=1193007 RepID=M3HI35_LEPBO|nr:hypothetical protein LEP1GSC123_0917 [Leptospira borgpetersenii str. 200701203]